VLQEKVHCSVATL
jgi:hypothetical protein